MLERIWNKGNTHALLVGMKTCITSLKISMVVSQKIGNQPTSGPSNTTLGHILKRCSITLQRHLFSCVHSSIICNSQNLKTTQMPLNERMDKENVAIYTLEYYSAVKSNDILNFACKWIEIENTVLSEITQTQKD